MYAIRSYYEQRGRSGYLWQGTGAGRRPWRQSGGHPAGLVDAPPCADPAGDRLKQTGPHSGLRRGAGGEPVAPGMVCVVGDGPRPGLALSNLGRASLCLNGLGHVNRPQEGASYNFV